MRKITLNTDAVSAIGCNIATGVILEKLMEKNIRDKKIYINIQTLYRNFINCLEGDTKTKIQYLKTNMYLNKINELFIEDTDIIINAFMELGYDIKLYNPTYKTIGRRFDSFKTVNEFTGLKYFILSTQDSIINNLKKYIKGIYLEIDYKLKKSKDMYMVTHIGLDLLNFAYDKDVYLIESHTGEIKQYDRWYTKYHKYGNKDMSILPFNEFLYRIFGDDLYIKPANRIIKRSVYRIAKSNYWHPTMSINDVKRSIKRDDIELYKILDKQIKLIY